MHRHLKAIALSTLALSLAACGGGGSGDTTTSASTTSNSGVDYVSKYAGTWKTACWSASIYKDTANGNASAYFTRTLTFTKASNTKLLVSAMDTVYSSTDTTCSGTVAATVTRTGQNTGSFVLDNNTKTITSSLGENSATYAGSASISGASGADNFDAVTAALSSTSNATLTVGAISLNSSDFVGVTDKIALYLNGTTLTAGGNGSATTYPTTLATNPSGIFTKQQAAN